MIMRVLLKTACGLVTTALLAGCAGYTLGPIKPAYLADVETIGVPMVTNATLEPRIESLVTSAIIKQIQQDGTYRAADHRSADVILEARVTELDRQRARSVRNNVLATREFRYYMYIEYTLIERETGRVLVPGRLVRGDTSFFVGRDLQQDERQAIPLAAQSAAVQLVAQISEGG